MKSVSKHNNTDTRNHLGNVIWEMAATLSRPSMRYPLVPPGPCITNVIATCRKNFSQWESSFLWKLRCHWLKLLRRVAKTLVIQGPATILSRTQLTEEIPMFSLYLNMYSIIHCWPQVKARCFNHNKCWWPNGRHVRTSTSKWCDYELYFKYCIEFWQHRFLTK